MGPCRLLLMTGLILAVPPGWSAPYDFHPQREAGIIAGGAALYAIGLGGYTGREGPSTAELAALDKQDIPAFERGLAGRWDPGSRNLTDAMLYTSLAMPLLPALKTPGQAKTIGLLYLETLWWTEAGVTLAKGRVKRYRPFAYGQAAPLDYRTAPDATRSFFSGHAAGIAAGLVFSAKVYSDLHPDSPHRAAVWTAALTATAVGAWQRVESGWHFPSDVLMGALWGGAVGYTVPELHRNHRPDGLQWLPAVDPPGLRLRIPLP